MKLISLFSILLTAWFATSSAVIGAPNTQDSAALVREGVNLFSRERYREAKVALQAALALNPESKAARYYLNLVHEREREGEAQKRARGVHFPPLVPIAPDLRT